MAALSDPFGAQLAAMKGTGGGGGGSGPSFPGMGITMGLGIGGSGKACTEEIHIPDGLVGLSMCHTSHKRTNGSGTKHIRIFQYSFLFIL